MSVYTNAASGSASGAGEYIAAVLALVGDEDPAEILARTPNAIDRIVAGMDEPDIRTPESTGKWSIGHVLQHLADSEVVWGYRLRMVIAQDRPSLTGYDQDLWADRLMYDVGDVEQARAVFATIRRANLDLLHRIPRSSWTRVAVHAERGEESVAHMMRLYAGHDILHLRQLERIRRAVAA